MLKPEVVFFGDSVPPASVGLANQVMDRCDGLLVAGSSLEVFSAYRLVLRATQRNVPVMLLNRGPTRAERSGLPLVKIEAGTDEVMLHVQSVLSLA